MIKNSVFVVCLLLIGAPLMAQNLVVNGTFDTDFTGWTDLSGSNSTAVWSSFDADDSPSSGSADLTNQFMNNGSMAILSQCFDVGPGDDLTFSLQVYQPSGQDGEGQAGFRTRYYPETGCTGSLLSGASGYAGLNDLDNWISIDESEQVPGGYASVQLYLAVIGNNGGTEFGAYFDNVVLAITPTPIFADGFESEDTSEWSTTFP